MNNDQKWLLHALKLAEQRRGFCAPNPVVGAVVIKNDRILGEGVHWTCGSSHAEVIALEAAGKEADGAILYVTLEPCAHIGRTPPCTDVIMQSGIREVIYGFEDPNFRVKGGGAILLNQAGIRCHRYSLSEIEEFYKSYCFWLAEDRPWVTAKIALSLDGKIAGPQGAPIQITGEECRVFTHQQRRRSDAILTSVATILADDPQLNVRLENQIEFKPLYILDSHLRLPCSAKIFRSDKAITVFHNSQVSLTRIKELQDKNVKCLPIAMCENGLNLPSVLSLIGKDGVHDLLVEAGGKVFKSFTELGLAQTLFIYIAPRILGEEMMAFSKDPLSFIDKGSSSIHWSALGDDAIAKITLK